jgi:hypothetical protein
MKEWVIKDLENFLAVSDSIEENPFKFYEIIQPEKQGEKEKIRAEVWLRTALISWEGEFGNDRIQKLKEHGFSEAYMRETKKIFLTELL